jgi:hypothetical protein
MQEEITGKAEKDKRRKRKQKGGKKLTRKAGKDNWKIRKKIGIA